MAVNPCAYCGASAEYFEIGEDGLCAACHDTILADVTDHVAVLRNEQAELDESEDLAALLKAADLAIETFEYLRDTYEARGVFVIEPRADEQIATVWRMRDDNIVEDAERRLVHAQVAAQAANSAEGRALALALGLVAIAEDRAIMREPSALESVATGARAALSAVFSELREPAEFVAEVRRLI